MRKLLLLLLLLPLVAEPAPSGEPGGEALPVEGFEQVEQALDEEEHAVSGELRLDGSYDSRGAVSRLWTRVVDSFRDSRAAWTA